MRQQYRLWAFGWMLALCASISAAQVTLDGTLGRAGPLPGPHYAITADLGQQRGGNLFHSFGLFSINRGESATFSGPTSVNNIISRVTGGQVSTIDGALRSTIPGANLYLLNPAGVLFGENAALDVPGSVHVSTADYVRLGDGGRFDARTPGNSVLTVAPVEAFGFLGEAPGKIEINGSFLRVPEGQTLSLIGGDIALTDATVYAPAGRINVAAVGSAGEVVPSENDLAMPGFGGLGTLAMERDPDVARVTVDIGESFTDVPLGDLDTSGEGGGAIFIRGGEWVSQGGMVFANAYGAQTGQGVHVTMAGAMQFTNARLMAGTLISSSGSVTVESGNLSLNNSVIASDTFFTGAGGDVHLAVTDTLTLLNGAQIHASTFGSGHAGSIILTAANLRLDGQGYDGLTGIFSDSTSTGKGGNLTLTIADSMQVLNGSQISANAFSVGDAGDVSINTGHLRLDGQGANSLTRISSDAVPDSTGQGGNITLNAADSIQVLNGSQIGADTFGAGDGGAVTLTTHNLLVDGQGSTVTTAVSSSSSSTGNAGKVTLAIADFLGVFNGGWIGTDAFDAGNAGPVSIHVDHLLLDGQGYDGFTGISSRLMPNSTGKGANVTLNAVDSIQVLNGSQIGADTFGAGDGGDVTLNARHLLMDGRDSTIPTVISSAAGPESTGNGGDVTLIVGDSMTILNGGLVTTNIWSVGDAGSVTISARNLRVDEQESDRFTGVASQTQPGSTGIGGDLTFAVADTLTLLNGGQISASTHGAKDAGSVFVHAGQAVTITGGIEIEGTFYASGLFVNAYASGKAGDITVTTPRLTLTEGGAIDALALNTTGGNLLINADHLKLINNGEISTSVFGDLTTQGGNVTLNSTNIVALNGSTITAQATRGFGGNITVNAEVFLHDAPTTKDVLNASSETFGNDGTVELNAPTTDISGSLVALNTPYLDVASQLSPGCVGGEFVEERSRFIVQGRGSLPPDPGDAQAVNAGRCRAATDSLPRTAPSEPRTTAMTGFGDR